MVLIRSPAGCYIDRGQACYCSYLYLWLFDDWGVIQRFFSYSTAEINLWMLYRCYIDATPFGGIYKLNSRRAGELRNRQLVDDDDDDLGLRAQQLQWIFSNYHPGTVFHVFFCTQVLCVGTLRPCQRKTRIRNSGLCITTRTVGSALMRNKSTAIRRLQ